MHPRTLLQVLINLITAVAAYKGYAPNSAITSSRLSTYTIRSIHSTTASSSYGMPPSQIMNPNALAPFGMAMKYPVYQTRQRSVEAGKEQVVLGASTALEL